MSRILESAPAEHANMTSSYRTSLKISSASKLQNNIQNIITNIRDLEALVSDNGASVTHVDRLIQQTDLLLDVVENSPLEGFAKKFKKRKEKRRIRKSKLKDIKGRIKYEKRLQIHSTSTSPRAPTNEPPSSISHEGPALPAVRQAASTAKNNHNRLLKQHDAQRFLRTFELLKILHFSRDRNADNTREFAAHLCDLRGIWSKVLDENEFDYTQDQHVEDQWSDIFFGPAEHSYYGGEQKMEDFLRVRRIWDTYLTHSKHGTSIPCGWVMPPENATAMWQQYRAT